MQYGWAPVAIDATAVALDVEDAETLGRSRKDSMQPTKSITGIDKQKQARTRTLRRFPFRAPRQVRISRVLLK